MAKLGQGKWKINANGYEGDLLLDSVDAAGKVTGKLFGDKLTGLWDESAQKLTFIRIPSYGQQDDYQFYSALVIDHLFPSPLDWTGKMPLPRPVMTGWFEYFKGTGGVAARSVAGWLAWLPYDSPGSPTLGPPYAYWYD